MVANPPGKAYVVEMKTTSNTLTRQISKLRKQVKKERNLKMKYNKRLCKLDNEVGNAAGDLFNSSGYKDKEPVQ